MGDKGKRRIFVTVTGLAIFFALFGSALAGYGIDVQKAVIACPGFAILIFDSIGYFWGFLLTDSFDTEEIRINDKKKEKKHAASLTIFFGLIGSILFGYGLDDVDRCIAFFQVL